METRKIGSLSVSLVGLGCNNFGRRLDAEATERVLHTAIDQGVTFFDTADIYGGTLSEEYMGRAMAGRWDQVVLATKFGHQVEDGKSGAHPAYVIRALEDSLRRLQTDRIDLYQLHRPDPSVPIADTLEALNDLVMAGKVREIGCSNFSVDQLKEAKKAVKAGAVRFVSLQNEYSLFRREPEQGVLAECETQGMGFLPYFPLASGLLTGKYRRNGAVPQGTRIQAGSDWLSDENLAIVEELLIFCVERGRTVLELAFSWLAARPVVSSVIAGATRPEQVKANASAATWKLTPEDLAEVDRILANQPLE